MSKKLTTEEFIERAKAVHGDTYILEKVIYVNSNTKVEIVCPKHGSFWIAPFSFLSGIGCKKCGYERNSANRTKTTEQFIEDARKVHGNKYDYSKVKYVNSHIKVCIICPIHGEFWMRPYSHLNGEECPLCAHRSYKYTMDEIIAKSNEIHQNKYIYDKAEYVNFSTKMCVICPKHGEFWITPHHHLRGQGCPKCVGKNKTTEDIIGDFKLVFGNKYNYSKVEYVNAHTKVCIICLKHGEFWIMPNDHLNGHGCPFCRKSKLEENVDKVFKKLSISSNRQKRFRWLCKQSLDFYLQQYNIAIECQGIQHFESVDFFGGKKHLEYIQQLDARKKQLCEEHGIKLYYINYNDDVETKLKEILKENGFDKVS